MGPDGAGSWPEMLAIQMLLIYFQQFIIYFQSIWIYVNIAVKEVIKSNYVDLIEQI